MVATIPFAFYAVFRYAYLVWAEDMERPETLFLDRCMVANLAPWGCVVVAVLYAPVATNSCRSLECQRARTTRTT